MRWVLGAALLSLVGSCSCERPSDQGQWVRRGHVLAWGATTPKRAVGTSWVAPSSVPEVSAALGGYVVDPLKAAMRAASLEGLWFRPEYGASVGPDTSLASRFAAGAFVPGFAAEVVASGGLLYLPQAGDASDELAADVLAKVARKILSGIEPPPLSSFPPALRTPRDVEVLVLLRDFGQVRLWRSARAASVASGVVRAAVAAAERWHERQDAMGGPLEERLARLDVEVAMLIDDWTLVDRTPAFIDRAVTPRHGVAYEQPGKWRYLLPVATAKAGSPSEAFRQLFRENDLPEQSFNRPDVRLYRFVMQTISVDQASAGTPSSTGATDSSSTLPSSVGDEP